MSHYDHKGIPNAKVESGSSSSFADMMSQNFPQKKGTSQQIGYLPQENGFNFKKYYFSCPESFFSSKTDPMSISAISKQRKIFFILQQPP